jgi:hypothetical protein
MPLESLTLAIFLKAEFGFLGVVVVTLTQTPRLNGEPFGNSVRFRRMVFKTGAKAGVFDFLPMVFRPFLIS